MPRLFTGTRSRSRLAGSSHVFWRAFLAVVIVAHCVCEIGEGAEVDTKKLPLPVSRKIDFAKDVYPILKENCIKCHGPEKQKGKYRIDTKEGAFKKGDNGAFILPGNSEKSPLIHMVAGLIEEGLMPPPSDKPGESEPLTKEQIGILRAWMDQGAEWPEGPIKEVAKEITFASDISPLFTKACGDCHTGAHARGGFQADSKESVLKGGKTYGKSVVPGDPAKSALLTIVAGKDEDLPLPEKHKLPAKQIELLKLWIETGAK